MAKKDLIADAKARGIKLSGDETVADLTVLLKAAGEAADAIDAEAGALDVDAIDADIESLKQQLADRLKARSLAANAVILSDAQAESAVQVAATDIAMRQEDDRRAAEFDATQESLARSQATGGTFTPQGVHYSSGLI